MATMQAFNFDIRNSATPSVDETASRYVPSSIYSGPGPAEESLLPTHSQTTHQQPQYYTNGSTRRIQSQNATYSQYEPRFDQRPSQNRTSTMLNVNDPITMHLLMETAIHDSKDFEILSFEELEQLKRERGRLRSRVEGVKRQIGLEKKMLEAAQLMSKLSPNSLNGDKRFSRKSVANASTKELDAGKEKVEQLSQEVKVLDARLQDTERRIMSHTAGILQFTHRGLKKNIRKNELPRSPESMASQPRTTSGVDISSEFDERSLYQVPDYVHDFHRSSGISSADTKPIDDITARLQQFNAQIHSMVTGMQVGKVEAPPAAKGGKSAAQLQAHLNYMAQGLETLNRAKADDGSVRQVENLTTRLNSILQRTNSIAKSPIVTQDGLPGDDIHSQLAYSANMLERLNQRVDTLLEQKDVLTRQIQQQRELNTKSDSQRDTKIHDLMEELEQTKKLQALSDEEAQQKHNQLELVMEQLDQSKQHQQILEQQRGMQESKALELERTARKESEAKFMVDLEAKQHALAALHADHSKLQNDVELKSQNQLQQLDAVNMAKQQAELQLKQKEEELAAVKQEMQEMESSFVQIQTELTMAKAELDGAYGSRAQRAADVSMNPEIKNQIDKLTTQNKELQNELDMLSQAHETKGAGSAELQNKVNSLQKELKDTIEDYEIMTKASIDFERERDRLEATIDEFKARCESLEVQISEDQVKWLGVKTTLPPDTTTTTMLKNEFKKILRDTRVENIKSLKAEQDERRRLEGIIRGLKKESTQGTPAKLSKMSTSTTASP